MFAGVEVRLELGFAAARDRLGRLAGDGALTAPSEGAYDLGAASLARVGAGRVSKLVKVQVRELPRTERSAGLALRWEAAGPVGGLFPVLDADVRLVAAGGHGTMLTIAGAYRPPFGPLGQALDRALLHRVAEATIRAFAERLAAQLTSDPGAPEAAVANANEAPDGSC